MLAAAAVVKRNITETLVQKPKELSDNRQAQNLAVADSNPAPQSNSQTIQIFTRSYKSLHPLQFLQV